MSRYAFIREHRARWPVRLTCRVLRVSPSGYYAWHRRTRPDAVPGPRQRRSEQLLVQVRRAYHEHRGVYGSPRVYRALRIAGQLVSRNTVAKLMRRDRLRARTRRRFVPRTTDSRHGRPVAPNVLARDFTAAAPDRKWVADITYVPTRDGWLFLAVVLDCYSRRIVGWAMDGAMPTELVSRALQMALQQRRPDGRRPDGRRPDGMQLVHHSDRGCQYASREYQQLLRAHGIRRSMSRSGDCYDNAMMESFFATFKTELVHGHDYATRDEARGSIFEYIEVFYNRRRLHSALGYVSPEQFEAA